MFRTVLDMVFVHVKIMQKYDVMHASFRCAHTVFDMLFSHVEVCKNHVKPVGGTCVPSGKAFFQFMVDNICDISRCVYLGEIAFGWDFLGSWVECIPWGEGSWRQSDGTRAAHCSSSGSSSSSSSSVSTSMSTSMRSTSSSSRGGGGGGDGSGSGSGTVAVVG